jgi:hypothetical protein
MQHDRTDHGFSASRQLMAQDFVDVMPTSDVDDFRMVWGTHSDLLDDARGLFVVDKPQFECSLPADRNFGTTGFLRSVMASNRLALIQSESFGFDFDYFPVVFVDTNFVSFCEACEAGRDLGANADAFRQAAAFLNPLRQSTTPYPYLLENAEHPNKQKLRRTLIAFAAFKLGQLSISHIGKKSSRSRSISDLEKIADDALSMMNGPDFRAIHSWAKHHFEWARIILLKSTLITFENPTSSASDRFYLLLKFLHEGPARFLQFETHVAYRYFVLNSQEPFFNPVHRNSSKLNQSLRSMAWDLAHWRMLFDISTVLSSRPERNPFPVPHFLSFDRRFIRLIEAFRLSAIIFSKKLQRCEQFYTYALLKEMSDVLRGRCGEFYDRAAIKEREKRTLRGHPADRKLDELEADLTRELMARLGNN